MADVAGEFWSLLQAVAWILTRDHRIVRRCSSNADIALAADTELRREIAGNGSKASAFGECFAPIEDVANARELSLVMLAATIDHRPFPEVDPVDLLDVAHDLLVQALGRGEIRATVAIEGLPTRVSLGSDEWSQGGIVVTSSGNIDVLEFGYRPDGTSGLRVDPARSTVKISARDLVELWPEHDRTLHPGTLAEMVALDLPHPTSRDCSTISREDADPLTRASDWMRRDSARPGPKPKRADAVFRCHQEARVTFKVARAAWSDLPESSRRGRGERGLSNGTTK